MITAADIKSRFPSFSIFSDTVLSACIAEAAIELDEDTWGTRYDVGLLYLSAHLAFASSGSGGGIGGPLTSKRIGDVSWSFAAPTSTASSLEATTYGQRYVELRSIVQGGPVTGRLTGVSYG